MGILHRCIALAIGLALLGAPAAHAEDADAVHPWDSGELGPEEHGAFSLDKRSEALEKSLFGDDPGKAVVPEPGTLALLGTGLVALAISRSRRKQGGEAPEQD